MIDPYHKELKEALLHDFTLLSNLVNSQSNTPLKHLFSKCKVLQPWEVKKYYKKLNMAKVRNSKFKPKDSKGNRRTQAKLRELIVGELLKAPQLSLYQIKETTNIDYETIRRFIKNNIGMLRVAKQGSATYIQLHEDCRRTS